jgi:hypothetical protein
MEDFQVFHNLVAPEFGRGVWVGGQTLNSNFIPADTAPALSP